MKARIGFVLTAALLVAACANEHVYVRDGVDTERTHADTLACNKVANPYSGDEAKAAFEKCMTEKGYEKKVSKYRF